MSGSSPPPRRDLSVGRAAYVAAYAVVGAALVWSRLFALGHSFWTDEIFMVEHYVRRGPREILAGADLSHELMAILAWATSARSSASPRSPCVCCRRCPSSPAS